MDGWKVGENVVGRIIEIPVKTGEAPAPSPVDLGVGAVVQKGTDLVSIEQQLSDLQSRVAALEAKVGIIGVK